MAYFSYKKFETIRVNNIIIILDNIYVNYLHNLKEM